MDSQQPTGHAQQNSTQSNCKSSVCMFFGSAATEGYCSVCYKKELKKREKANNNNNNISSSSNPTETSTQQQPTASTPSTTPSTTATTTSSAIMQSSISSSNNTTQPQQQQQTVTSHQQNSPHPQAPTNNQSNPIAISSPPSPKRRNAESLCLLSPGTPESGGASVPLSNSSPSKPKKRKCGVCKKKVGLTGFECRCGGLYCPLHRYGDKHNCTYDYKTEERNKLSKDNPVVQDDKIAKI